MVLVQRDLHARQADVEARPGLDTLPRASQPAAVDAYLAFGSGVHIYAALVDEHVQGVRGHVGRADLPVAIRIGADAEWCGARPPFDDPGRPVGGAPREAHGGDRLCHGRGSRMDSWLHASLDSNTCATPFAPPG